MMMKSQVLLLHSHITRTLIPRRDTFCLSMLKTTTSLRKQNNLRGRIRSFPEINLLHHISNPFNIISNLFPLFKKGLPRFFVDPSDGRSTRVKAIVTIKVTVGELEDFADHAILLELVSTELDPKTGLEKETIKGNAQTTSKDKQKKEVKYEYDLEVEEGFGEIGAVLVENEHHMEVYIETIELEGLLLNGNVKLYCNSWVAPKSADQEKRVFFTNKSYLPSQTPHGLRSWREKELEEIQGNGRGERKSGDRIYDYDVYNDLGYPDISDILKRPVLGGKEHPYPRRCRTGRPRDTDGVSETRLSRSIGFYVPKDEVFSTVKDLTFATNTLHNVLHSLVPVLKGAIENKEHGFLKFSDIDSLFSGSVGIPPVPEKDVQPRILKKNSVLRFDTPAMLAKDKFSWLRDEEFARQTLAGLNPYSIKLVTEWPLKSELDPKIYGSPEEVMNHELRSAITKDVVEAEIHGFMTLEEAVKEKKLFMLDYHDLLLPFVKKVRELKGKTLYGSRTLFFLTHDGTLRPLAIELIRPPMDGNPQWKQVFTPKQDATGCWLWRLAKTHVLAHDSGYHQLVSHWLRTHCATEPYIIATNRQLSVIHPIYRLLHPHFRYTMEINALARELLISADGIIEIAFSPGKYSMELSSAAYEAQWRFDHEALPADLLSRFMCFLAMLQGLKCKSDIIPVLVDIFHFAMIPRGMAVEDPTTPHGLKLTIEDYPFANDGLILWDAIKEWVTDYVKHYYPSSPLVESDKELQAWWTEIRTKGHADKKDEPWWQELKTSKDLIGILTTMIWVTSGHHSAVNFGQYAYAGYFPNRPAIARMKMPNEEPKDEEYWKLFLRDPETVLLQCYPSQIQATAVMVVLDVLSSHSPDEEYIGTEMAGAWEENPTIKAAFERFRGKLKELEKKIDDRNADSNLKNRNGAGVLPYELLKPFSEAGVTGMGVPNSISI